MQLVTMNIELHRGQKFSVELDISNIKLHFDIFFLNNCKELDNTNIKFVLKTFLRNSILRKSMDK